MFWNRHEDEDDVIGDEIPSWIEGDEKRLMRRLVRPLRGRALPVAAVGRQGELEGLGASRLNADHDRLLQKVTSVTAEARSQAARLRTLRKALPRRGADAEKAQLEAAIEEPAPEPMPRPRLALPARVPDPPAIPWLRLFLLLGFVLIEFSLTVLLPDALNVDSALTTAVAVAASIVMVAFPKVLGGVIQDKVAGTRWESLMSGLASLLGVVALVLFVVGINQARESILRFEREQAVDLALEEGLPEIPAWSLPAMAAGVSMASLSIALLTPAEKRRQSVLARQHVTSQVRDTIGALVTWWGDLRLASQRDDEIVEHEKAYEARQKAAAKAKKSVDRTQEELDATFEALVASREELRSLQVAAPWHEHRSKSNQRAMLQHLADRSYLESTLRPWPLGWLPRRPPAAWVDQPVATEVLERMTPEGFSKGIDELIDIVIDEINQTLDTTPP